MKQRFGRNSIDLQVLREFCEREGEEVVYFLFPHCYLAMKN